MDKKLLLDLTSEELTEELVRLKQPKFRSKQIIEGLTNIITKTFPIWQHS